MEQRRGQGLGRSLIRQVEDEARRRGCTGALLSIFDFQAPGFYGRLGCVPHGRLHEYPAGRSVYYLREDLVNGPDERA